jgi:uncharacterized protein with HEPN domain
MRNNIAVTKLIAYVDKTFEYTTDVDAKAFAENTMMLEACVFCLSQMGELAKAIDDNFKEAHPEIPWRIIENLRNRIVHDYEGVKVLLIWDIIQSDLPELKTQLEQILNTQDADK